MTETDPKWNSGDPQQWSTYWRACYKIAGSKTVVVEEYCRREDQAREAAKAALKVALEDIAKHGVRVEAACWTEKHQSRTQCRSFPPANTEAFVTGNWYGRFTVILKSIAEATS